MQRPEKENTGTFQERGRDIVTDALERGCPPERRAGTGMQGSLSWQQPSWTMPLTANLTRSPRTQDQ